MSVLKSKDPAYAISATGMNKSLGNFPALLRFYLYHRDVDSGNKGRLGPKARPTQYRQDYTRLCWSIGQARALLDSTFTAVREDIEIEGKRRDASRFPHSKCCSSYVVETQSFQRLELLEPILEHLAS